jgi:hypothetical protein
MPNLSWYGSPNFTPGRSSPIDTIVVHWMDGWLSGTDQVFQDQIRKTSAHYGIENDTIHQYVQETDTAWHAGSFPANSRSIGIEHSAQPGRPASDATYASSIWLIATLCRKYGLNPYTAIKPHNAFYNTQCPGTLDLDRLKNGVAAALNGSAGGTITPIPEDDMPSDDRIKQLAYEGALQALEWKVDNTLGGKTSVMDVARIIDKTRLEIISQTAQAAAVAVLTTPIPRGGPSVGGFTTAGSVFAYSDQTRVDLETSIGKAVSTQYPDIDPASIVSAVSDGVKKAVEGIRLTAGGQ